MPKLRPKQKARLTILLILIISVFVAFFNFPFVYQKMADFSAQKIGLELPGFPSVPFRLGLDLQGGTHLVYEADTSEFGNDDKADAVEGVRDVIERRVNAFGVAEPIVQINKSGSSWRVIVELAGVKDIKEAISMIGETPLLEFKEENTELPRDLNDEEKAQIETYNSESKVKADNAYKELVNNRDFSEVAKEFADNPDNLSLDNVNVDNPLYESAKANVGKEYSPVITDIENAYFILKVFNLGKGEISEIFETEFGYHIAYIEDVKDLFEYKVLAMAFDKLENIEVLPPLDPWMNTGLTGAQLENSRVEFDQNTNAAQVSLTFNDEGKELFADITKRNLEKPVAIYLDEQPISVPTVNSPILNGNAVITGNFTLLEAQTLSRRLNAGALPVPINLISQQSVGASLGQDSLQKSLYAGMVGLILIAIFMLFVYRLPGLLAIIALGIYGLVVLFIFKSIPVTLTLSGLAGFILSIGMAVDANVLIFERLKEELRIGKPLGTAIDEGFKRAWSSIRDGNVSTLITCFILMWFGTSMIKGFAITLGIGVLMSMFSAIVITKMLLILSVNSKKDYKNSWLYGVSKVQKETQK